MTIQSILQEGDDILHQQAGYVNDFGLSTQKTITDLIDTMRARGLVGIAAPQIGISQCIFITEIRETPTRKPEDADQLRVYINPKIITYSVESVDMWEGCGSIQASGLFGSVSRKTSLIVEAYDTSGNMFSLQAQGLLARVIQHEFDHINGVLFNKHTHELISVEAYKELVGLK